MKFFIGVKSKKATNDMKSGLNSELHSSSTVIFKFIFIKSAEISDP